MDDFEFHPVSPERWPDLAALFERNGKPNYCWCTHWRLPSGEYRRSSSAQRRAVLEEWVDAAVPVGILGYESGEPVAWCSVAPRETLIRLERSPTLPRLDAHPTWSVVCFFVVPRLRSSGLSVRLLRAATEYARARGATMVEGYPVEPDARSYRFMGSVSLFEKAGFRDVTPAGSKRRVMRYAVPRGSPAV